MSASDQEFGTATPPHTAPPRTVRAPDFFAGLDWIAAGRPLLPAVVRLLGGDPNTNEEAVSVEEMIFAYRQLIARRSQGTVWLAGGCASWYLDRHGHNTTLWPDFTFRFRRLTRRLDRENYVGTPAPARTGVAA